MWISYAGRGYRHSPPIGFDNATKMLFIVWLSLSYAIELFVLQLLCSTAHLSTAQWRVVKHKSVQNSAVQHIEVQHK